MRLLAKYVRNDGFYKTQDLGIIRRTIEVPPSVTMPIPTDQTRVVPVYSSFSGMMTTAYTQLNFVLVNTSRTRRNGQELLLATYQER